MRFAAGITLYNPTDENMLIYLIKFLFMIILSLNLKKGMGLIMKE